MLFIRRDCIRSVRCHCCLDDGGLICREQLVKEMKRRELIEKEKEQMEQEKQELMMRLYQFEERNKKAEKGEGGGGLLHRGTPGTAGCKQNVCAHVITRVDEPWANRLSVIMTAGAKRSSCLVSFRIGLVWCVSVCVQEDKCWNVRMWFIKTR